MRLLLYNGSFSNNSMLQKTFKIKSLIYKDSQLNLKTAKFTYNYMSENISIRFKHGPSSSDHYRDVEDKITPLADLIKSNEFGSNQNVTFSSCINDYFYGNFFKKTSCGILARLYGLCILPVDASNESIDKCNRLAEITDSIYLSHLVHQRISNSEATLFQNTRKQPKTSANSMDDRMSNLGKDDRLSTLGGDGLLAHASVKLSSLQNPLIVQLYSEAIRDMSNSYFLDYNFDSDKQIPEEMRLSWENKTKLSLGSLFSATFRSQQILQSINTADSKFKAIDNAANDFAHALSYCFVLYKLKQNKTQWIHHYKTNATDALHIILNQQLKKRPESKTLLDLVNNF